MRTFRKRQISERGLAVMEFALILPLLLIMVFGVIDFGRLIQARLIITNVSREGGSLVSRARKSPSDVLILIQNSATPLSLNSNLGKIYINRIAAGTSSSSPNPYIDTSTTVRVSGGSLAVTSSIGSGITDLGLPDPMYQHLRFEGSPQNTADIHEVWVVEVYYKFTPITPLPRFVQNVFVTPGYTFKLLGSRSIF